MTEPPIQLNFSDQVSLYTIHIAYTENENEKIKSVSKKTATQLQMERLKTAKQKRVVKTEVGKKAEDNYKMIISAKLIERMVCQNLYDDIVYGKKHL